MLVASAAIATLFAIASVSTVTLHPPKIHPRQLKIAGARTQVLIDLPRSQIADRGVSWDYFDTVRTRSDLLAQLMASAPAVDYIGHRAGIPADRIAAVAPITATVQSALTEPGSEQRAWEIELGTRPYRLEIESAPRRPTIDIYSQAPSTAEAQRLADSAVEGLRDYVRVLALREGLDPARTLRLHQLGPARGVVINSRAKLEVAALAFLLAFALSCGGLLALVSRRSRHAARASRGPEARPSSAAPRARRRGLTVSALAAPPAFSGPWSPLVASPAGALALRPSRFQLSLLDLAGHGGDWPRTTRPLPWMLAVFMAILWLVPFDSIQLNASLPIDLKFDRLVLPIVVVAWLLSLIAGGPGKPRLRLTWIHAAVGAFVFFACLSVVLDAASLNRTLDLEESLKKLPLLISYLSLFMVLASTVRRREVGPFLKYTLLLAVICAIGMLWEYRFVYNVFFDVSSKLLPGPFTVSDVGSGWDVGGRRGTHGPAAHGLVAVAMLSMALPIAVVGLMHARHWRGRLLYGLAACLLMAAMFATQRKTALIAPLSVGLTLAYFRRQDLLKIAPVAAILLVVAVLVSPGTLAPLVNQFKPDQLQATTVSDRASDYDAIRPDVWTHLAFGRGYGSYQPIGHRILDSEILVRTVETGVLGLAAFILLAGSVLLSARVLIRSREPARASPALAGAAAAVVFLVTATLFDTMSFPQVPYIFLCFAALVAALVEHDGEQAPAHR